MLQLLKYIGLLLLMTVCFAGCMTANQHRQKADKAALDIVAEYQEKVLGESVGFSIERPSDILRRRLIDEQGLPLSTNTYSEAKDAAELAVPEPLVLSLNDALQIAARNSREYQFQKEEVFLAALSLDLARDKFRNSFSGMFSSGFKSSDNEGDKTESVSQKASAGVTRTLQTGASISTRLAVDLVNLLTGDRSKSFGLLADATVSIPLLQGAGSSIAREPLTQSERDVIYALWVLERYKRSFAVEITAESLRVLRRMEELKNTEANYERIKDTRKRAESLGEAGRLDSIQVDQARQNELRARNQLVSSTIGLDAVYDGLKIKLGLPVDAAIKMDAAELRTLAERVSSRLEAGAEDFNGREEAFLVEALRNRLDMKTVIMKVEDHERAVGVAKDSLLATVKLNAGASLNQNESDSGGEGTISAAKVDYTGLLQIDLPWDKGRERLAYRNSLISLDQARRRVEAKEDEIKGSIRDALRRRNESLEAYRIQMQARDLAEKRVKSISLFQEAGRATIRDSLEAEEALLSAQNSALEALVSYQISNLQLLKELEKLEVGEDLLFNEEMEPDSAGLSSERGRADGL